jgi:tetratricopeptide (TPR) repeat protein
MDMLRECLAALEFALPYAEAGNLSASAPVFESVLRETAKLDGLPAREAEVVAHYGASRLAAARNQEGERRRELETTTALARALPEPSRDLEAVDLVADTLMNIGESRLAIPYCNRAVELTRRNAAAAAGRLWRTGRCYVRAGFPKEAEPPLTDAVCALRKKKNDPRLPLALLELGGALLGFDPARAEPFLREATELYTKAGHLNQAATAWINLGLACVRTERLDEALVWYEKAREARASDPKATIAQRGNVHNNIAGVWRRKKDFARARQEVSEAIAILTPEGGPYLCHALGTMGEICRDEGLPEEALVWFRRAREEFERQPNPNVEQLATKLENEAQALASLGRADEAAQARERIAALKGIVVPAAPSISPDAEVKEATADEQAVIVTLDGIGLSDETYAENDLATLEHQLETLFTQSGGGELDGHEHGPEDTRLFLYGPDARALYESIAPVLRAYPLCRGARITLQQGDQTTEFHLEDVG